MADYNIEIYDALGRIAVPSVHNSYYIQSEFSVSPNRGPFVVGSTMPIGLATIPLPVSPIPTQSVLLLAKNDPSQAAVGLYGSTYSGGVLTSITVAMEWGKALTLAIALPEVGGLTDSPYGMQVFGPSGTNIIYDSRRPNSLISKGGLATGAGYITGSGVNPQGPFDYFSSPMHHHGIWRNYGEIIIALNRYWQFATGLLLAKATGPSTLTLYASEHDMWYTSNLASGGGPSSFIHLFSKV